MITRQRLTTVAPKYEFQTNKKKKILLALRQQDHFLKGAFGMILGG